MRPTYLTTKAELKLRALRFQCHKAFHPIMGCPTLKSQLEGKCPEVDSMLRSEDPVELAFRMR